MMEQWSNKSVWRLLWPLILEQLLAVTIGIADTAMVTTVGEDAISGVSLVDQINQLLIIAFSALATGGSVVVSQYIGRGDTNNSINASKQLLLTNSIVSLVIMFATLFSYKYILLLIYGNIELSVMENARRYFWLTALSMPFFALYTASSSLFRAAGNSRLPMITALLMNIINIGGNALFIFVFKMGVTGAALATLLCRVAGSIIMFIMQIHNRLLPIYPENLHTTKLEPVMIKRILNIGIPGAVESSVFQIGKILLSRVVSSFGTAALAANAITGSVASFVFMPGTGFCMALLTVAGQCIGAKDYESAKHWTFKLMRLMYITLAALNILILFTLDRWLGLFNLSSEAAALTKTFLRLHCITSSIAWPLSFGLPNALRAAGDAKFVMYTAICTMWFVRISSSFIFAYVFNFGALAVWMGMGLDFFFRGSIFTIRWLNGKWQTKKVI
ncbi:MAG: MATE family efflux transporter [Spirochaetaceae bacterium]|jgi:putative MATE family efflux protein|nr:MATE family efflux transporter [Spirochaetaceae bacterium]